MKIGIYRRSVKRGVRKVGAGKEGIKKGRKIGRGRRKEV